VEGAGYGPKARHARQRRPSFRARLLRWLRSWRRLRQTRWRV
jgi:hypothetical protein